MSSFQNVAVLGPRASTLIEVLTGSQFTTSKPSDILSSLRIWNVADSPFRLWEICSAPQSTDVYSLLPTAVSAAILITSPSTISETTSMLSLFRQKPLFLVIDIPEEDNIQTDSFLPSSLKSFPIATGDLSSKENIRSVKHAVQEWLYTLKY
ncbi:hypothetical protein GEMRC1_013943 [Eukaryota sp. GEM-RC1]